jgi:hypothetical protein
MGISPGDAKRLTYWEFTAMRHGWEQRHKTEEMDGEPAEPPTEEFVRERQAELAALGISGGAG